MAWSFYQILPITARPRSWSQDFSRTTHSPLPHCCHPAGMAAAGSGLNQLSWCSGHVCGTAKAPVLCLKYKMNVPNNQAGPCKLYVQVCACTPQPQICKNTNIKSRGWGLLKISTVYSKLNFESQIHNTTGQPTSNNSSCDFSLRCSENFSEKVFLLYLLFHISELTFLGWMFADRKAPRRQEVTFWQLCLPGALPRKDTSGQAPGCNCSPCRGKTKGHGNKN